MLKEYLSVKAQNFLVIGQRWSTDETARVLDAMDEVRVIHQENKGKPCALNAGLKRVRGEAVLVLDDDDLLLPGALNVLGHALFQDPSLAVVYGDSILFEDSGERFSYWPGLRYPSDMMQAAVLQQIPCATGATLIRMSVQREVGEYDERLKRGEDMTMLRLSQHGRMEVPLPTFISVITMDFEASGRPLVEKGSRRGAVQISKIFKAGFSRAMASLSGWSRSPGKLRLGAGSLGA